MDMRSTNQTLCIFMYNQHVNRARMYMLCKARDNKNRRQKVHCTESS